MNSAQRRICTMNFWYKLLRLSRVSYFLLRGLRSIPGLIDHVQRCARRPWRRKQAHLRITSRQLERRRRSFTTGACRTYVTSGDSKNTEILHRRPT